MVLLLLWLRAAITGVLASIALVPTSPSTIARSAAPLIFAAVGSGILLAGLAAVLAAARGVGALCAVLPTAAAVLWTTPALRRVLRAAVATAATLLRTAPAFRVLRAAVASSTIAASALVLGAAPALGVL